MSYFRTVVEVCGGITVVLALFKMFFGKAIDNYIATRNTVKQNDANITKVLEELESIKKIVPVVHDMQDINKKQEQALASSKVERMLIIKGLISVCRRLIETGANGTVSHTLHELEEFLYQESHK